MNHRLVVTGIGLVSPLGHGPDVFMENLSSGKTGIGPIERFSTDKYKAKTAGELISFDISDFTATLKHKRLPRISQYALASALLAVSDAKLKINNVNASKIGLFFGTWHGAIECTEAIHAALLEKGFRNVEPSIFQESSFNAPISHISINLKITGPSIALPLGVASGSYAIRMAMDYLQTGLIDVAVVGAADEHTEIVHDAFESLRVLSQGKSGEEVSRPFDKNRNGLVLSEGGAFFVIEKLQGAKYRDAKIYGELAGVSIASDAYMATNNNPNGRGIYLTINQLLNQTGISKSSIDCILAAASSTQNLDLLEARGIIQALSGYAADIPVTSIKGALGESGGASSIFNVITALMMLRTNQIPPICNYYTPDPEFSLNIVSGRLKEKRLNNILVNDCFFGGTYASILVQREGVS